MIKKFNTELEYGRKLLDIAMRNQHNLKEIRERVGWLEKEIEKILLTNKNVINEKRMGIVDCVSVLK